MTRPPARSELLSGLSVLQVGPGRAAAVCGRLLADVGADVSRLGSGPAERLDRYLDRGKRSLDDTAPARAVAGFAALVCEGSPKVLAARGINPAALTAARPALVVVCISPFGQTGPDAERPASDLTAFAASGIARILAGQVDDPDEPPLRPAGGQSAFIGGLAAACAAMHALVRAARGGGGALVDVSRQEALASLAVERLARAARRGEVAPRRRTGDGNGATVTILVAADGYVAISPREEHQWRAWLEVMGNPEWGGDPRFATHRDRAANFDSLHALMSEWSRTRGKQAIALAAQAAHVPSFPLREPAEQLDSGQLRARGFFRDIRLGGTCYRAPGIPFGITLAPPAAGAAYEPDGAALPLAGVRVLDLSWVIAGPTTTRYLAAMGADVIKVEAPGRGDPGRASELHAVLGQAKRGIALDLKHPEGARVAQALAARCDVVVENFATGVMERLGLSEPSLREANPGLVYVSASGLGRRGPEAGAVAYGTLLQCYAGFAGLNRTPGRAPRVGMAWLDPMCGLMLAFVIAAALWRRRDSRQGARIDFSMIEAMLWTMAEPLLAAQDGAPPSPRGNASARHAPHGVFRARGDDAWIALAVTGEPAWRALVKAVPELARWGGDGAAERHRAAIAIEGVLGRWLAERDPGETARRLGAAGIAAAAVASALDLADSPHLRARGFWDDSGLPGLPWRSTLPRREGRAPGLGEQRDEILSDVLGLDRDDIARVVASGAVG